MKDPVKDMRWAKWPIGDVTQWYGENPRLYANMGLNGHNGIDIVRPHGEHLFAVESGWIVDLKNEQGGYGKHIRILAPINNRGEYREWTYGHLSEIHVTLGQWINAGQFVAKMGNTGFVVSDSTGNGFWDNNPYKGTHLHIGVRDVKHDNNGWRYDGYGRGVAVLNYDNGRKGALNPLPFFRNPKLLSSRIISIASAMQDSVLFMLGQLLRKIDL